METKVKQNPAPGLPDPEKAAFKLVVYFKNGTKRTYYSYHTAYIAELKKVVICDKTGLNKLQRLIVWKFAGAFKTAIIYHINREQTWIDDTGVIRNTETQICKYVNDKLIQVAEWIWEFKQGAVRIKLINNKAA
jgi:hypothetical protein